MTEQHLIVWAVNALLDPVLAPIMARWDTVVGPILTRLHIPRMQSPDLVPDYLAMSLIIVIAVTIGSAIIKSRIKVEDPSRWQIVLEDIVGALASLLDDWIGPQGRQFLPLVGALGTYILLANYSGLVPGLLSPTSNVNVPLGCAITIWVYYHFHGIRAQGLFSYLKHFAVPPGSPVFLAPMMIIIEPISHLARVLSLTLRLFGNIFGEEMLLATLATLVPFILPLPIMFLSLITGLLQAFIFVLLSVIYLQGAVVVDGHDQGHHRGETGHDIGTAELAAI